MGFRFVGQVIQDSDSRLGRIEVAVARGIAKAHAEEIVGPIVYISKYRSGQLGERSIGMSMSDARAVAALLRAAAES
ncbi:MAG: hypothetical protein M3Y27_12090 [Acidobacteriota bacterium]|nr:hypothetical protein [Acidobacteriota bacterium]